MKEASRSAQALGAELVGPCFDGRVPLTSDPVVPSAPGRPTVRIVSRRGRAPCASRHATVRLLRLACGHGCAGEHRESRVGVCSVCGGGRVWCQR